MEINDNTENQQKYNQGYVSEQVNSQQDNKNDSFDILLSRLSAKAFFETASDLIFGFNSDMTFTRFHAQKVVREFDKFLNSTFINNLKLLILLNVDKSMADKIEKVINSVQSIFSV